MKSRSCWEESQMSSAEMTLQMNRRKTRYSLRDDEAGATNEMSTREGHQALPLAGMQSRPSTQEISLPKFVRSTKLSNWLTQCEMKRFAEYNRRTLSNFRSAFLSKTEFNENWRQNFWTTFSQSTMNTIHWMMSLFVFDMLRFFVHIKIMTIKRSS